MFGFEFSLCGCVFSVVRGAGLSSSDAADAATVTQGCVHAAAVPVANVVTVTTKGAAEPMSTASRTPCSATLNSKDTVVSKHLFLGAIVPDRWTAEEDKIYTP